MKALDKSRTIIIRTDEGVKYNLRCETDETVKQIKFKLDAIFGANCNDKHIFLNGKILNDRQILDLYMYKPQDTLYLEESKILI